MLVKIGHSQSILDASFLTGNDSIVAFSRLRGLSVVIHQLNAPLWRVGEGENYSRELHISFHNGDHYNSVRRMGEAKGVKTPANIKISLTPKPRKERDRASDSGISLGAVSSNVAVDGDQGHSEDDEEEEKKVRRVMKLTGCEYSTALQALEVNANCVEAAVEGVLKDDAGPLWSSGGTGERILGPEAAKSAAKSQNQTSKLEKLKEKRKKGEHLTNKQRMKLKREEKRVEKNERRRANTGQNGVADDQEHGDEPIVANMQALTI